MTSEMHSMAKPRDPLEIEGTLLPPELPVAMAVTPGAALQTAVTNAVAAAPLSEFTYNTTQETNAAVTEEANDQDIPTAPFLPPYDDSHHRERKEAAEVARGKRSGKIAAELEREAIGRANRQINSIEWHTKRSVEEARRKAKRQNVEGVQIKEDKWFGREDKDKDIDINADPDAAEYAIKGGYEVSDYETSDYKGYKYETSEYKSVYDR